jgi:hypothetical protein
MEYAVSFCHLIVFSSERVEKLVGALQMSCWAETIAGVMQVTILFVGVGSL